MTSLESLHRRIALAQELQSVVKTMKVFSAASIRQYERAVQALADYTQIIEQGLQIVLPHQPEPLPRLPEHPPARIAAILLGTDQGMCGQFTEQLADYALTQLAAYTRPIILTVGTRLIPPLEAAGQPLSETFSMPSSLTGITPMVQTLLLCLDSWQPQLPEKIILFYHQYQSNTVWHPYQWLLLPIDQAWLQSLQQRPWPSRVLPSFTMAPQPLFASLIRQHLFICLYRALAESLASENASRLIAMQMAEQNITERLAEFNAQFQHERQTRITEEILEIASGTIAQSE
jgi:F-type H+-transporting ATPase subunit gamma